MLVHVPLVQEIFGLRKKNAKPKPPSRRLSKIYNAIDARNSASWKVFVLCNQPVVNYMTMYVILLDWGLEAFEFPTPFEK